MFGKKKKESKLEETKFAESKLAHTNEFENNEEKKLENTFTISENAENPKNNEGEVSLTSKNELSKTEENIVEDKIDAFDNFETVVTAETTASKSPRSKWIWILSILTICVIATLSVVGQAYYQKKHIFTWKADNNIGNVKSFWETLPDITLRQPPVKMILPNVRVNQISLDPNLNYGISESKIFSVKNASLIYDSDLLPIYKGRKLLSLYDGIAMFEGKEKGINPFLDLRTKQPVERPAGVKVIDPLGIYSHDLLVARIKYQENGKTYTVGFNSKGQIVWKYNSYCQGVILKQPQLLLLEKCHQKGELKPTQRLLLDVKDGSTHLVDLGPNGYFKNMNDHLYVVNPKDYSVRYLDSTFTLVPAGSVDWDLLNKYDLYRFGHHIMMQTYSLTDRLEGLKTIENMLKTQKNKAKNKNNFVVLLGGKVKEIDQKYKCDTPLFFNNAKKYVCGITEGKTSNVPSNVEKFMVYNSENHAFLYNDDAVTGSLVRFNGKITILKITPEHTFGGFTLLR